MKITLDDVSIDEHLSRQQANAPSEQRIDKLLNQVVRLVSPTPELDGAIVHVDRYVTGWLENQSPHSVIYCKRLIEYSRTLPRWANVLQVTIKRQGPECKENGPFRNYQSVWVNDEEIGPVYNGLSSSEDTARFTRKELYQYIGTPNHCPFSNCVTAVPPVLVGVSFKDGMNKVRKTCPNCEGTWTEILQVVGVK